MTQKERLREALLLGKRITRIEALTHLSISRLAARIDELDGEMNIIRGWRRINTKFDDTTTRIREYWTNERAA